MTDEIGGGDRKSKSPPCRRKRDKDGAPSGVEMSERVGQPREKGRNPGCFDRGLQRD